MAKTERLFAVVSLDGETQATATRSMAAALEALDAVAVKFGDRTVLWDTLEISISTDYSDNRTLTSTGSEPIATYTTITASAMAVRND